MTWWQWLICFAGLCVWGFSILIAVVIGGKLAKGEPIEFRPPQIPKPSALSPRTAKALWRDQASASDRAYADKIANMQPQGKS